MKYDIEADWILLQTCNYRCSYCFAPPEMLGEKLQTYGTPQQWRAAFDATDRTWLLHITGGEPSIYPGFVDLCDILAERHYLSLNSNLTHASLQAFAKRVDPSRVSFVNAGFHLEERDRRSGHAAFLTNGDALRAHGFSLLVSLVATPAALARFDDAAAILRPLGLVPVPKLFRGLLDGKLYPDAYSQLDKERFLYRAELARECYAPMLESMAERPTADIFRDDELLEGEPTFTGMSCDAGHRFVRIEPNGDVNRCGPPHLGNLLAGTFAPRQAAAPCDTRFCYYFCKKYTDTARVSSTLYAAIGDVRASPQQAMSRRLFPRRWWAR
jgi:MoaA/NifB/PqqE/SkfB family radical SAM enzyme